MTTTDDTTTVAELVAFIDRARMALTEAGRPDLAERVHVNIGASGQVRLSTRLPPSDSAATDDAVEKFLTLDPYFQQGTR